MPVNTLFMRSNKRSCNGTALPLQGICYAVHKIPTALMGIKTFTWSFLI
jgi:hypothetical protein